MLIQVFSEYLQLAQAGRVNFLACPMHQEDPEITYQLIHRLTPEEEIVLDCFACGYKKKIGIDFYNSILEKIKNAQNLESIEPKKRD
jgi:hypothetical protein